MPLYRPLECGPQSRECCLAVELAVHSHGIWGLRFFRVMESGNGPQPCSIFRDPDDLENGGQVLHTAAPGLGGLRVCGDSDSPFQQERRGSAGRPLPAAWGPWRLAAWWWCEPEHLADGPGCSLQVVVERPVDPVQSTAFFTGPRPRLLDPS